ncbi:uncharacterized protein LOC142339884 isoform X1 [Convolutriloba macropyga]|uniref:uncharacterized protein LOC142339884 isoform X1 n=1 Tax=Convolutriloba macropyga TaxID=536237 RepID=UPI003F526ED3
MVVAINFWDMPGQDRTPTLNAQLVRDSQVVILVFDLSDKESFDSLREWKNALNSRLDGVPVFLMGNKLDLIPNQRVAGLNQKMREFSSKNSTRNPIVQQFLVSAKADDQNLSGCLQIIIEHMLRENMPLETNQDGIPIGRPRNQLQGNRKLCPCV